MAAIPRANANSKRRGADTRQVTAPPTIAMTLANGPVLCAARTGGAWTGGDAAGYAGRTTTFVLIGVRE
jgi:hypothetical protein